VQVIEPRCQSEKVEIYASSSKKKQALMLAEYLSRFLATFSCVLTFAHSQEHNVYLDYPGTRHQWRQDVDYRLRGVGANSLVPRKFGSTVDAPFTDTTHIKWLTLHQVLEKSSGIQGHYLGFDIEVLAIHELILFASSSTLKSLRVRGSACIAGYPLPVTTSSFSYSFSLRVTVENNSRTLVGAQNPPVQTPLRILLVCSVFTRILHIPYCKRAYDSLELEYAGYLGVTLDAILQLPNKYHGPGLDRIHLNRRIYPVSANVPMEPNTGVISESLD
jgi:hypothetical protein